MNAGRASRNVGICVSQMFSVIFSTCRMLRSWKRRTTSCTRILAPDDLVVVEGHADSMEIGRCARVTGDAAGLTFQNHLFRLRTTGEMTAGFACMWLNSGYAKRFWNARCATSSGLHTINQRMLKRLALPVPRALNKGTLPPLLNIAKDFETPSLQKRAKLQTLKQSLMHDLLTGKVRVNDMEEASAR